MFLWVLVGMVLGILAAGLIRTIARSSLAEMSYITLLDVFDEWKRKRRLSNKTASSEAQKTKELPAAAGRFTLL